MNFNTYRNCKFFFDQVKIQGYCNYFMCLIHKDWKNNSYYIVGFFSYFNSHFKDDIFTAEWFPYDIDSNISSYSWMTVERRAIQIAQLLSRNPFARLYLAWCLFRQNNVTSRRAGTKKFRWLYFLKYRETIWVIITAHIG